MSDYEKYHRQMVYLSKDSVFIIENNPLNNKTIFSLGDKEYIVDNHELNDIVSALLKINKYIEC